MAQRQETCRQRSPSLRERQACVQTVTQDRSSPFFVDMRTYTVKRITLCLQLNSFDCDWPHKATRSSLFQIIFSILLFFQRVHFRRDVNFTVKRNVENQMCDSVKRPSTVLIQSQARLCKNTQRDSWNGQPCGCICQLTPVTPAVMFITRRRAPLTHTSFQKSVHMRAVQC